MSEFLCPRFWKMSITVVFLLRMLAVCGVSSNCKVAFLIFFRCRDFDSHTDVIFIYVFIMHSRKGMYCA